MKNETREFNLADSFNFFYIYYKWKEEMVKAKASFYHMNIRVEWSIHVNLSASLITSSGKYECQRIVTIAYPIDKHSTILNIVQLSTSLQSRL